MFQIRKFSLTTSVDVMANQLKDAGLNTESGENSLGKYLRIYHPSGKWFEIYPGSQGFDYIKCSESDYSYGSSTIVSSIAVFFDEFQNFFIHGGGGIIECPQGVFQLFPDLCQSHPFEIELDLSIIASLSLNLALLFQQVKAVEEISLDSLNQRIARILYPCPSVLGLFLKDDDKNIYYTIKQVFELQTFSAFLNGAVQKFMTTYCPAETRYPYYRVMVLALPIQDNDIL